MQMLMFTSTEVSKSKVIVVKCLLGLSPVFQ